MAKASELEISHFAVFFQLLTSSYVAVKIFSSASSS
jgi:hypothetical protein